MPRSSGSRNRQKMWIRHDLLSVVVATPSLIRHLKNSLQPSQTLQHDLLARVVEQLLFTASLLRGRVWWSCIPYQQNRSPGVAGQDLKGLRIQDLRGTMIEKVHRGVTNSDKVFLA